MRAQVSGGYLSILLTLAWLVAIFVATKRRAAMPKFATVRELKNQTTALLREAEKGKPVVVTRRGRPVATLRSFEQKDLRGVDRYPTTGFDALRKRLLAKHPQLARETPDMTRREFDRITRKIRQALPFKSWREMDRFLKGDRHGLR
jgi:prevent-host-death family protein